MAKRIIAILIIFLGTTVLVMAQSRLIHDDYGNTWIVAPTGNQRTDTHVERESYVNQPYYQVPNHPIRPQYPQHNQTHQPYYNDGYSYPNTEPGDTLYEYAAPSWGQTW